MNKEQAFVRFYQVFDYLKSKGQIHSWVDFAKGIGVSKSYMSDAKADRGGKFSEDFLKRIGAAYSDYISEEWLLTGEGEMAKTFKIDIPKRVGEQYLDLIHAILEEKAKYRPHIEAKASAGFMDGLSMGDYGNNQRPLIPGMPDYDFTITAEGNSMLPKIEDGDILVSRKAIDRLNPPIGKICVLDTKDGKVVKVIKSVNEDSMTLHSLNPAPKYHDYDIDLSSILNIAEVVGLVRSF